MESQHTKLLLVVGVLGNMDRSSRSGKHANDLLRTVPTDAPSKKRKLSIVSISLERRVDSAAQASEDAMKATMAETMFRGELRVQLNQDDQTES